MESNGKNYVMKYTSNVSDKLITIRTKSNPADSGYFFVSSLLPFHLENLSLKYDNKFLHFLQ